MGEDARGMPQGGRAPLAPVVCWVHWRHGEDAMRDAHEATLFEPVPQRPLADPEPL